MARSRRVLIDNDTFAEGGQNWTDNSHNFQYFPGTHATISLPFSPIGGGNAAVSRTITVWDIGIVSFGAATAEQIAFVESRKSPFADLSVGHTGFPGEFIAVGVVNLAGATDANGVQLVDYHSDFGYSVGFVDFDAPYVPGQAVPTIAIEFNRSSGDGPQLVLVENGFSVFDGENIGYSIGSETVVGSADRDGLTDLFNFYGTIGEDRREGTDLADRIFGFAGNDVLYGHGGNDVIMGGLGNDHIDGGEGMDLASYMDATSAVVVGLYVTGPQNTRGAGIDTLVNIEGLLGSNFDDILIGDAGDNVLAGGGGNDTLRGGIGNDIYYVEDAGDVIIENSSQGTDTVFTGLGTYWLQANVENLIGQSAAGQNLGGNGLNNSITGGAGNDRIVGGAGIDRMAGGLGDDIYSVDHAGDMVIELANQGNDSVFSSVSYSIAVQHVENIALTGTAHINATGNSLYNILIGNSGDNIIDGRGGRDVITGGAGRDQFHFTTPLGTGNVDKILDFTVADDSIGLSRAIFTAAGPVGVLGADAFTIGTTATDASDRIIYDSRTGVLLYDADGSGSGAAQQFALIGAGLALTHEHFLVL